MEDRSHEHGYLDSGASSSASSSDDVSIVSSSTAKVDDDDDEDDYYSILANAGTTAFPLSIDSYPEELQLQEVIVSSLWVNQTDRRKKEKMKKKNISVSEESGSSSAASSSNTSTAFCNICMEMKPWGEMFDQDKCSHVFCFDCVSKHIAAKVQENTSSVPCPEINCNVALEPQFCQAFLPLEVFQRWADALCESLILASQKFYCPFRDCQALMVDDAGEVIRASECATCRRLFCAQCKVPWHPDLLCEEFQKLDVNERENEDRMLVELAKEKKWQRCPRCKFIVEKSDGCLHITCRCKYEFCYRCGCEWRDTHRCPVEGEGSTQYYSRLGSCSFITV
ncbi:hypothetical protein H6P81_002110 [Aristolochia fimbriata]|uniref:RBR-type E3 ubiquitin transferase n=1 Tax=Aristolochia fimbriata TaxID=158543 RepID=A0AAV7FC32_ARIFI|nr:hypothetical protein H6P81_002110 [Aristolochia fimbriata]